MDTAGRVLDILFRQASPERVLRSLKQRISGDQASFLREKSRFDSEKEKMFKKPLISFVYFLHLSQWIIFLKAKIIFYCL